MLLRLLNCSLELLQVGDLKQSSKTGKKEEGNGNAVGEERRVKEVNSVRGGNLSSTEGKARSVGGNPHCAGEMMPTTDVLLAQEIVMK